MANYPLLHVLTSTCNSQKNQFVKIYTRSLVRGSLNVYVENSFHWKMFRTKTPVVNHSGLCGVRFLNYFHAVEGLKTYFAKVGRLKEVCRNKL